MSTIKILLEVSIDNSNGWLGLDDYKQHDGVDTDLEAFEEMARLESTTALHLVLCLSEPKTKSKFLSVESV